MVGDGFFCMVRAYTDTFAAINAFFTDNMRLAIADADGLRRAAAQAMCAASALAFVERNAVCVVCHIFTQSQIPW